jgi:hypothetical protein
MSQRYRYNDRRHKIEAKKPYKFYQIMESYHTFCNVYTTVDAFLHVGNRNVQIPGKTSITLILI